MIDSSFEFDECGQGRQRSLQMRDCQGAIRTKPDNPPTVAVQTQAEVVGA